MFVCSDSFKLMADSRQPDAPPFPIRHSPFSHTPYHTRWPNFNLCLSLTTWKRRFPNFGIALFQNSILDLLTCCFSPLPLSPCPPLPPLQPDGQKSPRRLSAECGKVGLAKPSAVSSQLSARIEHLHPIFIIPHSRFPTPHSSFVIRHSSFVISTQPPAPEPHFLHLAS